MESMDDLIEKLIPGQLKEFNQEVMDLMYDRSWCKNKGLDYSNVRPSEIKKALYQDFLKAMIC